MRLKQTEYCHNCDQHVVFEFDDVTLRQLILCPNCGHEHYRELDEGTLLNIQMQSGTQGQVCIAHCPPLELNLSDEGSVSDNIVEYEVEVREIIGNSNGRPIVKAKEGEKTQKVVSNRRWGVDQNQRPH